MQHTVKPFKNYVLRTPSFPISNYKDLVSNYSFDKLLQFYNNNFIKEALTIASPDLMEAIERYKKDPSLFSTEKLEALEITLLKYLARITSRCTPFGLFAGCSVGKIDNQTNIVISAKEKHKRSTKFDMSFWSEFIQKINKREDVIPYLVYSPNNSLYVIADFYRYIEYEMVDNNREYKINSIRKSSYLDKLLLKAQKGLTITELIDVLTQDHSEKDEAKEFILELIESQILISNLETTITGSDELATFLKISKTIPTLKNEYSSLLKIKEKLQLIDEHLIPNKTNYKEIRKVVDKLKVNYQEKHLFQTDMNCSDLANVMDKKIISKTQQAINFLNGITEYETSVSITNFSKTFQKRYEDREIPLTLALDTELGIGYLSDDMKDSHPILDQFSFNGKTSSLTQEKWTKKEYILQKKLLESIHNDSHILLDESDFPDFKSNWVNTPATFSVMIELLKNDDNEQIVIDSAGGMSAAKLLGRFCNSNKSIYDLTTEIINRENEFYDDKILAEVVHIPQARTGNILRRPILRKYEIPYLTKSNVPSKNQIAITDLLISIKDNGIVLRSKRLNKEVIPCLSNAHNYGKNTLPIYHFLCDLQSQNKKPIYSFNWGTLETHYNFFPRVYYKDVIISKAKWSISSEEIKVFYSLKEHELSHAFSIWKTQKRIPRYVNWVQSDNLLLLDLEVEIGIKLFLKSVKNSNQIILEEFLFSNYTVVKNTLGENFTNQIILSFFNEKA
jgi:hypothetical protein